MTKIRHSTITYTLTTHILTTELDFSNTILGRFCHLKKVMVACCFQITYLQIQKGGIKVNFAFSP